MKSWLNEATNLGNRHDKIGIHYQPNSPFTIMYFVIFSYQYKKLKKEISIVLTLCSAKIENLVP